MRATRPLTWSLIKHLSSKENTDQGRAQRQRPGARLELQGSAEFAAERPVCRGRGCHAQGGAGADPGLRQCCHAPGDVFVEELQAAVLGRKGVALAMDDVARRVKPLLP
jgi:hypothetical protein